MRTLIRPSIKALVLFILVLCHCETIEAQSLQYFDTVEVTTTQIPLKITETGRDITVIRSQALQSLPASSLDEVLQTIPGVEVQSRNGFGAQGDILMRGSTFTQVLVLIDGLKMNDPLTAHFNSNIPVTNSEIERIEILRGPAAAMYGPDAVGGVINIITKVFADAGEEESQLSAEAGIGSNQQYFGQVSGGTTFDRLQVSGSFQFDQSDGELLPAITTSDNTVLPEYRNYFDIKTGGLSLGYLFRNGMHLKARSGYDYRDFSARYFYTSSPFDKSTETVTNWFNALELEKSSANASTRMQVGFRRGTDEFIFSPDFPSTNYHETNYFNFQLHHFMLLTENLSFKAGLQADQRKIESNDRGNHQDWHWGGYAMAVLRDGKYNLSGSLRMDYDENYDFEISPQINFSYVMGDLVWRAAAGRSIRAADYTERYVSNNLEDLTPGRNLGNPYLQAERSWSEEVGLNYHIAPPIVLKSTLFFRQSKELIDYVLTPESEIDGVGDLQPGGEYYFAQNIFRVQTWGVEFSASYSQRLSSTSHLDFSWGYSHIETSNEEGIVSVYLANHARDLVNFSSILRMGNFDVGLSALFKHRNEREATAINATLEPSYFLLNGRVGFLLASHFRLNFQVQNIFDQDYQNILGAPMPGRWLMGSVSYSL